MAVNPISYLEIDAYCRLFNIKLSEFELNAIKRLDMIAIGAPNKPIKQRQIDQKKGK